MDRPLTKIPSFTINHLLLRPGVYLSRRDVLPKGDAISTFDIRLKTPNLEPGVEQGAIHTIEHLAATFLRNHPVWGARVVYFGPMGCLTGCYLLLEGDLTPMDVVPLLRETFAFVANFKGEVPGATARDCGNAALHNLPGAREEAARFLRDVLNDPKECQLVYPE